MNTYDNERKWTQSFYKNGVFWKMLGPVQIKTDKKDQYAGIDLQSPEFWNIDLKFYCYKSISGRDNFFVEMYNTQHSGYENSYIKGPKDGKLTNHVLNICPFSCKAYMIKYETVHQMALIIDEWLKGNSHRHLTTVKVNGKENGTQGMIVPVDALKPIKTFTFQLPKDISIDIKENAQGALNIWSEFEPYYLEKMKTQLL